MMAGKPVDTTPTMTGKGLRVELRREPNDVATGRSSNWGRPEQYAVLISTPVTSMVCSLKFEWQVLDTPLRR